MSPLLDTEPESVAIVRLRTGLGDLLCSVPALRALRRRLPRARITLITWAEMGAVVARQSAYVDELMPFPGWPGIPERPPSPDGLPGFLAACREREFDLALQMYGLRPEANEVCAALGARRTGGFFAPGRWPAPDLDAFLPYPEHVHEVDRHLALMELLGAPSAVRELEFPLSDADRKQAAQLGFGWDARPFAVLHPGATSSSRRWGADAFAAVGDGLAADGLDVVVTGVPGEQELVSAVVARMRAPAHDLCARTSLGGFAALLASARLLVASDTGAAHLAAATRTPAVVVFLSGDPVRWAHPGHAVARVQVECNPCPHLDCPIDHRCAVRLEPAHVLGLARELAGAPRLAPAA